MNWPELIFRDPPWLTAAVFFLPLLWIVLRRSVTTLPVSLRYISLVLRTSIALLIVASLAGTTLKQSSTRPFVVFVTDVSDSTGSEASGAAIRFIRAATQNIPVEQYCELTFARNASPPVTASAHGSKVTTGSSNNSAIGTELRDATDIQKALESAAACVPPGFVPHIVVLSDGLQNRGDALHAASKLAIRTSTVSLSATSGPEISLASLRLPEQIAPNEPFQVEIQIESDHDDHVHIELHRDDRISISEDQLVGRGTNRFFFTQRIERPTKFTASLGPAVKSENGALGSARINGQNQSASNDREIVFQDTWPQNNTQHATILMATAPRVLLIESEPDPARSLQRALQQEGLDITPGNLSDLPSTPRKLQLWDALILSNVSATDLSIEQMQTIRTWVVESGGGLVMTGGDQSFGLGGYFRTVVEDVLPVASDFQKEQEKPSLGLVLLIDKSGSMGGTKIELAKDAAKAAVELLGPNDHIGVIAFDGRPWVVTPMGPVTDRQSILDSISAVQVGGGTSIYPGMKLAYESLQAINTGLKHLIVLTDGYSIPGDFEGLTKDIANAKITVSTAGIGDADPELLKMIADLGHGRSYFSSDPAAIPQIFAKETLMAGQDAIREDAFIPQLQKVFPAFADIDFSKAPQLLGYVATRAKPSSEVILRSPSGDPVLAWWRYGLGTAAAFTSDSGYRWGVNWLTWEAYSRFWAQLIRHCSRRQSAGGMDVTLSRTEQGLHVSVDSSEPDGRLLNGAETMIQGTGPEGAVVSVQAEQTGPGQYEARLPGPADGEWQLHIAVRREGIVLHERALSSSASYPDEYRPQQTNTELLRKIASVTGGYFQPAPQDIFTAAPDERADIFFPLRPMLLQLALMMFVLDVAVRRLPRIVVSLQRRNVAL